MNKLNNVAVDNSKNSIEEQLSELFGSFKAEWLKGTIFNLFTQPSYFPELLTHRPCVLVGGRGTGKTTVLRSLSYEGQFALNANDNAKVKEWPFFGFYYKVNSNHVTAFQGAGLTVEQWTPIFAHYLNIVMCNLILEFLVWYQETTSIPIEFSRDEYERISIGLNIEEADSISTLKKQLYLALIKFQAHINNVADRQGPALSMQKVPVDLLVDAVLKLPVFTDKNIFFLIDEYENLLPYQQKIANTILKHSETYTFKIGVREEFWVQETLAINQPLSSPADYNLINITNELRGERFKKFALSVCNQRIAKIELPDGLHVNDIVPFLPTPTEDEEASLLGIEKLIAPIKLELRQLIPRDKSDVLEELTPLEIYFFHFWALGHGRSLRSSVYEFLDDPVAWETRFYSYKHALLYTIKSGKPGIRKYYAGWDVFTQISATNIRYLMELVAKSLSEQYKYKGQLSKVSYDIQTHVAQGIGKKYLHEAQELATNGAQLTRLLLGLGRVFGIMASQAGGHAAEVNQFHISDELDEETDQLMNSAVANLVLIRTEGTKLDDPKDTREYDYMVHPVFSPYFEFSYRKKRKMTLSSKEVLGLANNHKVTIPKILKRTHRSEDEFLPEQLSLFKDYYYGNS